MNPMIRHYDALIDENNDLVHDPAPLKEYMDQWDGQRFIDEMQLGPHHTVLEIGVGTGRIAIRVAPLCGKLVGIDVSPKTVERARENLKAYPNTEMLCLDLMDYQPREKFDVIYSSLTWMHIQNKKAAMDKVCSLLKAEGRFLLSIDKNPQSVLDYGTRRITVYPDRKDATLEMLEQAGMKVLKHWETEFAHIFVSCIEKR